MMMSRAGNIDSFCLKLSQSNVKRLLKIPCEHKCHTKYGSGSKSGHDISPKSEFFGHAAHDLWSHFARKIKKSKPFGNLTPCKSTAKEGRFNPGSFKGKFSNLCFWIKMGVSEPV